ncbi:MAG: hypothetical protein AAF685_00585 [Cyanobacteria bacterium P01_C01_bin.89]
MAILNAWGGRLAFCTGWSARPFNGTSTNQPHYISEAGLMTSQTTQIKNSKTLNGVKLTQWLRRGFGGALAAIALGSAAPALAAEQIQVGSNFSNASRSGVATNGSAHSCGELSQTFTLNLASDQDSLRVSVDDGPLVLFVTGPGGEYCIKAANGVAEMEGYWMSGQYQVQVGRRSGTSQNVPFNFTVSAQ